MVWLPKEVPPYKEPTDSCHECGKCVPKGTLVAKHPQSNKYRYCPDCGERLMERDTNERRMIAERNQFGRAMNAIQTVHAANYTPDIVDLWRSMLGRLGGLEGFAEFYVNQIKIAAEEHPGGRLVLEACRSVVNLSSAASARMQPDDDLSRLSDSELKSRLERVRKLKALQALIEEMPELGDFVMQSRPELLAQAVISEEEETVSVPFEKSEGNDGP